MQQFKRSQRVAELIGQEISQMLLKEIKDPRIGFVTLTKVELSDDLRMAKVYVSLLQGDEPNREKTLKGLNSAARFIRGTLTRRLNLRYAPEIVFKDDRSLENVFRVAQLLETLNKSE